MTTKGSHYIGGKWIQGKGSHFASYNPANDHLLWSGYEATLEEIDEAFKSAKAAFLTWALLPVDRRISYLIAFESLLQSRKDTLAKAISEETGKPLWDAKGEVSAMIAKIPISIEAYTVRCPEVINQATHGKAALRHKPHGVLTVFGPYNFPGHLPNGHIIPALLAGNTLLFKPSEQTPFVAELLMSYWEEAGLPPGILNLLQGGKNTGIGLAAHPSSDGLLFTGSSETGSRLLEQFAKKPQHILALEMGGNNPLVVNEISDLQAAAYLTIQSAFITSGQRCTCARRLILVENAQNALFLDQLIAMTASLKLGAYDEVPEPFMGPVISKATAHKLLQEQQHLLNLKGKSLLKMTAQTKGEAFLTPGIIDMTHASDRPDKEIFGPLLQLVRVKDFQEALDEANRTAFGLTAGLFSDDPKDYEAFYTQVKAGVINWNTQLTGASSAMPFGGIGKSGNHRPSAFYAADYCAYPVASQESQAVHMPQNLLPGISYVP